MAKVYDALKQVEAERSLQLRRSAERERESATAAESTLWRRVSGRLAGRNGAADEKPLMVVPEPVSAERVVEQSLGPIRGRLDALEQQAAQRLPEIERDLLQRVETRIGVAEREMNASLATLRNQTRREVAEMQRRVYLLLGLAGLLLAVVLSRG